MYAKLAQLCVTHMPKLFISIEGVAAVAEQVEKFEQAKPLSRPNRPVKLNISHLPPNLANEQAKE
jgi:hypothetical protein